MKRALLFALLALLSAPAARTEEAGSPLASKLSTFEMDPASRNPFWPIGWKPLVKMESSNGEQTGMLPPTVFHVSSITMQSGKGFAIINGRIMEEGQIFGLQMGNQTYQVTVKSIQDGHVVLARRDQEIIAPLRRK